ncbi:hypothetical protein IIA16_03305, partial [bacterium]|nr:hypothetical protein [bacterium]
MHHLGDHPPIPETKHAPTHRRKLKLKVPAEQIGVFLLDALFQQFIHGKQGGGGHQPSLLDPVEIQQILHQPAGQPGLTDDAIDQFLLGVFGAPMDGVFQELADQ